ncbi:hypothetical protein K461DRAFT_293795 [Myriangium duriaei CBS 260.36]|uniref:Uncharacterized protein n=1 Tax=Myriangium duriaei CBS 260.36 TaxID=1168546 RepID=A0A9P4MHU0_9PEZI|nr:hypothetical protein K461DRAFT_293795 [Myriangium duriaei CBS 260.36]
MQFKTALLSLTTLLLATGTMAAAVPEAGQGVSARATLIAPDPTSACNCPKNCSHHAGSSCKFYRNGNVITGVCNDVGGHLICQD